MVSGGNFQDYIRFLFCQLFGPVNHRQYWKEVVTFVIINDNQAETCLIITINDTCTCDLPLMITISDTSKNQPKRLDSDNQIRSESHIF